MQFFANTKILKINAIFLLIISAHDDLLEKENANCSKMDLNKIKSKNYN